MRTARLKRFPILVLVLLTGCGGGGSGERASNHSTEPWDASRGSALEAGSDRADLFARLERGLPERLGADFACVVAPADERARLLVYVTRTAARGRAREVIRSLDGGGRARVRTSPLESQYALRVDLIRRLRRNAPEGVVAVDEEPGHRTDCPRVVIYLGKPPEESPPAAQAWARAMVEAFGTRRVFIGARGRTGFLDAG